VLSLWFSQIGADGMWRSCKSARLLCGENIAAGIMDKANLMLRDVPTDTGGETIRRSQALRKRWSEAEIYILKGLVLQNTGLSKIARFLKRSEGSVLQKAYVIRLALQSRVWSRTDIWKLEELVDQKVPLVQIAVALNRTASSAGQKARELGLSLRRGAWSRADVTKLKRLARQRMPAAKIAHALKRTEGATRQKARALSISLNSRQRGRQLPSKASPQLGLSLRRDGWSRADVAKLKRLARQRTPAAKIAHALKRTEGATRQKARALSISLNSRQRVARIER
jgi:hypothetical protein